VKQRRLSAPPFSVRLRRYLGIGLCWENVPLNRLPGWETNSFGYHADDGNSFCQSGTGKPYGPTFTTGDTVGCGINFIDSTVFFTKNGIHLGGRGAHAANVSRSS
jgi:hypothetical protein